MKKQIIMKKIFIIAGMLMAASFAKAQTTPKVLIDNNKVKVTEYDSAPGKDVCGAGKHSHPAHLTVLLTEATVTITGADGKVVTQKVPAGTVFWSEAETHEVINSGTSPVKAYLVETK
jgi:hypothetical protein